MGVRLRALRDADRQAGLRGRDGQRHAGSDPHEEPDWAALPAQTPAKIKRSLRKCLRRDAKQRLHDIADARLELEELSAPGAAARVRPITLRRKDRGAQPHCRSKRRRVGERDKKSLSVILPWALAAAFAAAAGALALRARAPAPRSLVVRPLTDSGRDWFPAASPDGKLVAFVSDRDGRERIWLKQMPDGDERPADGGAGRPAALFPRRKLAPLRAARGRRDVALPRGRPRREPRRLVSNAIDGAWSVDGRRLAWVREAKEEGRQAWTLNVGSADASEPREIYRSNLVPFDWPAWSPDGKWITCFPHALGASSLFAGPLLVAVDGSGGRDIGRGRTAQLSAATWFGRGREALVARAAPVLSLFEAGACTIERVVPTTGEHSPVLDVASRVWSMDVLGPGRLVFDVNSNRVNLREVPVAGAAAPGVWLSRGLGMNRQPRYSPDGQWILYSALRGGNVDVWSLQPATGAVRRLTDSPAIDFDPAWTPDGKHLIFSSNRRVRSRSGWPTPTAAGRGRSPTTASTPRTRRALRTGSGSSSPPRTRRSSASGRSVPTGASRRCSSRVSGSGPRSRRTGNMRSSRSRG